MKRVVFFWRGSELSHVDPSALSTGRESGIVSSFKFLKHNVDMSHECAIRLFNQILRNIRSLSDVHGRMPKSRMIAGTLK